MTTSLSLTRVASAISHPRTLPSASCATTTALKSTWTGFYPLSLSSTKSNHFPVRRLVVRAARTDSRGVSLGFRAPDFQLPEPLTGNIWKLEDFGSYPALLVMFMCNHCPFVKHLKKDIVKLTSFYMKKGLAVVAISSNSVATHPQDGPKFMAEEAKVFQYPFPYLYDESQEVARAFGAVCTPEFFLFKKVINSSFLIMLPHSFVMAGGHLSWYTMVNLMIPDPVTMSLSLEETLVGLLTVFLAARHCHLYRNPVLDVA